MGFGQHQSFHLRVNWLSKAAKMVDQDPRFFFDDFGFEKIGLGRNMFKSLKFWALATNIIRENKVSGKYVVHELTEFGRLFYKYDRFIRLPLTRALLHYFLISRKDLATSWYWFFNEYSMGTSTIQELQEQLRNWASMISRRPVSDSSIRRDIECIKQVYTMGTVQSADPEEVIASPLASLGLIEEQRGVWMKSQPKLERIGLDALYFLLLDWCFKSNSFSVTLDELQLRSGLWGKIFNLSINQMLQVIEQMEADDVYEIKFVRTNQIYELHVPSTDRYNFLEMAYQRRVTL
ncbi:DUF4007 family protein [Brevibacillus sp. LEMMJ03]|uniref:DUF4007 family protein n=1 Tax=Brevibacillus sp. LEMMJ03 TaxID=2595056 RepID=UPI001180F0FB|nr:DUF4007 family protein [Brevibacillus sp. LEMMJ03]TRY24781.1 DUF4007 family protein [Brevibacillus sp. LEMMJ03]